MNWLSSNSWYSTTGSPRSPEVDRALNNDYMIHAQTYFWVKRVIANQTDFTGLSKNLLEPTTGPLNYSPPGKSDYQGVEYVVQAGQIVQRPENIQRLLTLLIGQCGSGQSLELGADLGIT